MFCVCVCVCSFSWASRERRPTRNRFITSRKYGVCVTVAFRIHAGWVTARRKMFSTSKNTALYDYELVSWLDIDHIERKSYQIKAIRTKKRKKQFFNFFIILLYKPLWLFEIEVNFSCKHVEKHSLTQCISYWYSYVLKLSCFSIKLGLTQDSTIRYVSTLGWYALKTWAAFSSCCSLIRNWYTK